MKKFIIRLILIVVIPSIFFFALCEYCIRIIPNDYSYKNGWMTNNINKVKILNLGSSHGYYGIDPSIFSVKSFNAAYHTQSIKYDYFIFNKFYNQMDSLRVLILPISYPSLFVQEQIMGKSLMYYSIYYNCDYHRFIPKYNLEIWHGLRINKIINFFLEGDNYLQCDELGYGTTNKYNMRCANWKNYGFKLAKSYTVKECYAYIIRNIVRNNYDYLKILECMAEPCMCQIQGMIKMCAKKNATVILLTMPTHITYRENIDSLQMDVTIKKCKKLEREYNNVIYMNLFDDSRFVDEDFFDTDHLDEFGATKLTMILKQTIDSLNLLE